MKLLTKDKPASAYLIVLQIYEQGWLLQIIFTICIYIYNILKKQAWNWRVGQKQLFQYQAVKNPSPLTIFKGYLQVIVSVTKKLYLF